MPSAVKVSLPTSYAQFEYVNLTLLQRRSASTSTRRRRESEREEDASSMKCWPGSRSSSPSPLADSREDAGTSAKTWSSAENASQDLRYVGGGFR